MPVPDSLGKPPVSPLGEMSCTGFGVRGDLVNDLYQVKENVLYFQLSESFYRGWVLNFVKYFF